MHVHVKISANATSTLQTERDLAQWSILPISMARRVNTDENPSQVFILFSNDSLFLPKSAFGKIDSSMSSFVWCERVPRMRRMFLEVPKSAGGLGLPSFIHYYWVANVSKMPYWISMWCNDQGPVWAKMELNSNSEICPISLLSSSIPVGSHPQVLNLVIKHWF